MTMILALMTAMAMILILMLVMTIATASAFALTPLDDCANHGLLVDETLGAQVA